MALRVALLGTLLALAPAVATAQERSCRQVLPSDARRLFNARGQEIIYFRDPVRVLCTGGLRLEADSAVMNRTTSTVQLVGDVLYRDSTRELTADWANYIGARSQLLARGTVVLRNVEDGSVVEGEELDYLQASDERPQAYMTVRGGRPYAVIPPQVDSGEVADTAVPTEIWADRMEFEGEEIFRGMGNVELRRGAMTGAGSTATFVQPEERMTLMGEAFVETDRYRLDGERIEAFLAEGEIRTVTADRAGRVESEDLTVEADRIRIGFAGGQLERLEAWNPEPDSTTRALADARDFRLRADSIDARADSVGIQEVRAVGRAYGERGEATPAARVPPAIARDWIQGDTILGFFAHRGRADTTVAQGARIGRPDPAMSPETRPQPDPELEPGLDTAAVGDPVGPRRPAPGDSTETVLERIVVIGGGGPALSLYRMAAETEGDPPSINFLKADRITLFMVDGDVARVDAEGGLEGIYLAPAPRRSEEDGGAAEETDESGGAEGVAGDTRMGGTR